MARRPDFTPGHFYHLFNRGANRATIFREEDNYVYVLHHVKEVSQAQSLTVIAYCLLPNHYHFLVRQDGDPSAGLLAQYTFNAYSKAFNLRYKHDGTLFQGPYRANWIDSQRYLINVCRYIHANPVRHGLVSTLEEWPYSNYLECIDKRNGSIVDRTFMRDCFGTPEAYRLFVEEYVTNRRLPAGLVKMLQQLEA